MTHKKKMTKDQWDANEHMQGFPPEFYAKQLILFLENNLMPELSEEATKTLVRLSELLEQYAPVVA